jgi:high-affinity K+ transport system ATPase subunit B
LPTKIPLILLFVSVSLSRSQQTESEWRERDRAQTAELRRVKEELDAKVVELQTLKEQSVRVEQVRATW